MPTKRRRVPARVRQKRRPDAGPRAPSTSAWGCDWPKSAIRVLVLFEESTVPSEPTTPVVGLLETGPHGRGEPFCRRPTTGVVGSDFKPYQRRHSPILEFD